MLAVAAGLAFPAVACSVPGALYLAADGGDDGMGSSGDGSSDIVTGADGKNTFDGTTEGGSDAHLDAITFDAGPDASCLQSMPPGWTVTAYAVNAPPCPVGYSSTDVVENPVAGNGACGCSCSPGQQPVCDVGNLATSGNQLGCAASTPTLTVSGNGCNISNDFQVQQHFRADPLPVSNSPSCNPNPTQDKGQVTTTSARLCEPTMASDAEQLCDQSMVPSGYASCIWKAGDIPCEGNIWTKKVAVAGTDFNLSCTGCTCGTMASCGAATATFFSDLSCGTALVTVAVNGTCWATQTDVLSHSFIYYGNPSLTCTPSGANPSTALVGAVTICCR